jgi:hypothetical protein
MPRLAVAGVEEQESSGFRSSQPTLQAINLHEPTSSGSHKTRDLRDPARDPLQNVGDPVILRIEKRNCISSLFDLNITMITHVLQWITGQITEITDFSRTYLGCSCNMRSLLDSCPIRHVVFRTTASATNPTLCSQLRRLRLGQHMRVLDRKVELTRTCSMCMGFATRHRPLKARNKR